MPAAALERLARACRVRPAGRAPSRSPRTGSARSSFSSASGFPTAPVPPGARRARAARRPCARSALPALLKTSRLGYDGKGQAPVERPEDAAARPSARSAACRASWSERLALETRSLRSAGPGRRRRAWPPSPSARTGTGTGSSRPRSCRRGWPPRWRRGAEPWRCGWPPRSSTSACSAVEMFVADGGRLSSTSSRRGRTTAATTRSTPAPWTSSSSSSAPSAACRWPSRGCSRPVAMVNLLGDLWARRRAALGRASSPARRAAAPLRQGRAAAGAEDGSPELPRRRSSPGAGPRRWMREMPWSLQPLTWSSSACRSPSPWPSLSLAAAPSARPPSSPTAPVPFSSRTTFP